MWGREWKLNKNGEFEVESGKKTPACVNWRSPRWSRRQHLAGITNQGREGMKHNTSTQNRKKIKSQHQQQNMYIVNTKTTCQHLANELGKTKFPSRAAYCSLVAVFSKLAMSLVCCSYTSWYERLVCWSLAVCSNWGLFGRFLKYYTQPVIDFEKSKISIW